MQGLWHKILGLVPVFCLLLLLDIAAQERANVFYRFESEPELVPLTKGQSIEKLLSDLQKQGFALASIDQVNSRGDSLIYQLYQGPQYQFGEIRLRPMPTSAPVATTTSYIPQEISLPRKGEPFFYPRLQKLEADILQHFGKQGFPFVALTADTVQLQQNQFAIQYHLDLGAKVLYDTLHFAEGEVPLDRVWLEKAMRLKPQSPYALGRLKQVETTIRQWPFVEWADPPSERYFRTLVQPVFPLKKRAANEIDGIIGFLPNEQARGQLLFTGQVNLKLFNLLGYAEALRLEWQSMKPDAQLLDAEVLARHILGTPFEATGKLYLLREDSTLFNLRFLGQVSYVYPSGFKIGLSFRSQQSQLLTGFRSWQQGAGQELASTRYNATGIVFQGQFLDSPLYPRKGWQLYAETGVGNKESRLPNTDSGRVESPQIFANLRAEYFQPMGKRSTWLHRIYGEGLWSKTLFFNELLRFGGLRSFRGFNENFFFSARHAVLTSEYRLFTDATTFFGLFADQGIMVFPVGGGVYDTDFPTGLGLTAGFKAGAGVISLSWAVGRSRFETFDFLNSKLHVGITGRF